MTEHCLHCHVLVPALVDPYSVVRLCAHRSLIQVTGENIAFDYSGSEPKRSKIRETYDISWQQNVKSLDEVPPTTILLEGKGRVRQDIVDRIYQQRDNRRQYPYTR